jgi:hypothetical protein
LLTVGPAAAASVGIIATWNNSGVFSPLPGNTRNQKPNSLSVMKNSLHLISVTALAVSLLASLPLDTGAASPLPGFVDFGQFTKPTNGELVQINLNGDMIGMAMQLAGKAQPDFAEVLRGLHSIQVNVVGLDDQNREEITTRVKNTRSQLDKLGWQKIVSVQEKTEDVGIYLKTRGQEAIEGVVVTVLDGRKEAVFINVAGDLKMEKLASIGEKLNVDALKKLAGVIKAATQPKQSNPNAASSPDAVAP